MSATALVFEERHYTLPQLEALADGLAVSLRERGVTAGERVALMASNRPEFVVALHAIWRLAAVVVLISPAWKRHEVEHAGGVLGALAHRDADLERLVVAHQVQLVVKRGDLGWRGWVRAGRRARPRQAHQLRRAAGAP